MRYASLLVFALAIGLAACKGSSAPENVATPVAKERTTAQIIRAWRREGFVCEDGRVSNLGNGAVTSYARLGPILAKNGDWYVGCEVTLTGAPSVVPGLQISCYRVDPDTLEVTNINDHTGPLEERRLDEPCESLPGWPQE